MTEYVYDKMDPEVKAKWVEALRSGRFKQGQYRLKDNDGCNCCLGVLAEINDVPIRTDNLSDALVDYFFVFSDEDETGRDADLPDGYCGIDSSAQSNLIEMNDGTAWDDDLGDSLPQKTFPEIADWIEKNL